MSDPQYQPEFDPQNPPQQYSQQQPPQQQHPSQQQPPQGYGQPSYSQYPPQQAPQHASQQGGPVQPWQPQQQGYPQQPGYPQAPVVAPRSPALGLIVSFFLPGVGSMIAGQTGKGIGILIGYIVGWFLCLILIGFVVMPAFWIWGMIAAWTDTKAWNQAHGIIS